MKNREFRNSSHFIWSFHRWAKVSHCGKYLLVHILDSAARVSIYYTDLHNINEIHNNKALRPIVQKYGTSFDVSVFWFHIYWDDLESQYYKLQYVTNDDLKFVFYTNTKAPNFQVIVIDFENMLCRTLIQVRENMQLFRLLFYYLFTEL